MLFENNVYEVRFIDPGVKHLRHFRVTKKRTGVSTNVYAYRCSTLEEWRLTQSQLKLPNYLKQEMRDNINLITD